MTTRGGVDAHAKKKSAARRGWTVAGVLAAPLFVSGCVLSDGASRADDNTEVLLRLGAELTEIRFCRTCHELGGEGKTVGPNLDQVTLRRTEEWLKEWLRNPPAVKPGSLMPIFPWTEAELDAIIAYLTQYREPVDGEAILAEARTGPSGGQALIEAYQCWACHKVLAYDGRPIYPDLYTVKERRTAEWEKAWLQNPQAIMPGTFMPTFGFSQAEIEAITDYLYR